MALNTASLSNLMAGLPPDASPAPAPVPLPAFATTPILVTIKVNGDTATIVWTAVRGLTYRVQFKESLEAPEWQDLSADQLAYDTEMSLEDTLVGRSQRFYRVIVP